MILSNEELNSTFDLPCTKSSTIVTKGLKLSSLPKDLVHENNFVKKIDRFHIRAVDPPFFCGIRSGFRHFELHASTTKRKIRDFYLKFSGELCAFDTRVLTLNKIWFGVRSADEVRRPLLSLMARKKNMNVNKRNHQSALRQPIDVTRGEHFSWLVRWAARFLACFNYDNNIGWRQRRCQFTAHTWLALQAESCSFSDNEKSALPSNTTCFWITSLLQQVPGLFPTAENTTQTL